MPFLGIGLYLIIAIFFAIHAIKTGQQLYWLIVLFTFPLLGSVVYFFAIYLLNSKLERKAMKTFHSAVQSLDPGRELREATAAFEYSNTAQNRLRLADALAHSGDAQAAAVHYEACLSGVFADDLHIKQSTALAYLNIANYDKALHYAQAVRQQDKGFNADVIGNMIARAYAGKGQTAQAYAEFAHLEKMHRSVENMVDYALYAKHNQDTALFNRLVADVEGMRQHAGKFANELNAEHFRRLKNATG
jgi:hypothetical protein